ncbi:D-aspartate oxidase [Mycena rebaudengoi]|nr:D-aspartate oxidase [Mycena rebaudengoi]
MGKHVFVVGAGVVGLSTAIKALEAGFRVTVFAELFPGDPKSIKYTSAWAAANHISIAATNTLLHEMEQETLQVFLELIKEDPLVPVMICPQIDYTEMIYKSNSTMSPAVTLTFAFSSRKSSRKESCPGVTYSTIFMDVPRYLPYLMNRFLVAGGHAFRVALPSLSSLLSEKERPQLVPFASESARNLWEMWKDVYPTRGEVLIIRAPWINHGMSYFHTSHLSYIIPRQSGDVILGGTFQVDDWHPTSRPETVKEIKELGIKACPELLPADKRDKRDINDLEVIEECVGLRPTRKGGLRLETTTLNVDGNTVSIIHNYGHGGAGYQSSWGSARHAVDLLKSTVQ